MILEVPELPVGAVADRVGVFAGVEDDIGVADPDAYAVRLLLGAKRLRPSVARDALHVEARDHARATTVGVAGREVAEDAAADLVALGTHAQRLGHLERAVGPDLDVALPGEDALVGARGRRGREQGQCKQRRGEEGAPHQDPTGPGSNSKYSAGANLNSRAGTRSGNVAIRVFRLLTAPL